MSSKNKVWIDFIQGRYFLIPQNQQIKNGDYLIYRITGDEKKVDRAALKSFEITEEKANKLLLTEINQALEQPNNSLINLLTLATQTGSKKAPSGSKPSSNKTDEGWNIISTLLGVPQEALASKPQAAQESINKLLGGLKAIMEVATAQNSEQLEKLREQMHTVQQRLQNQGIQVDEDLEKLPNQLRECYLSTNSEQNLEEMSDNLRKFADQLDQLLAEAKENDDKLSLAFLKGLRGFLSPPEDDIHEQDKRQQEYRKDARDSIERARQGRKIPSFSFDDLLSKSNQTKSSNKS